MITGVHTPAPAAVWQLSILQLPIWYRASEDEARRDPWLTVIYDRDAGLLRAVSVGPSSPTVDEVLHCLEKALPTHGDTASPVIQTDMSPLFTSFEFQTRVEQLGVDHYFGPDIPKQTGGAGVEVWFRDMCLRCLSRLNGYRNPEDPVPAPKSADLVPLLQYSLRSPQAIEDEIRLWEVRNRPGGRRRLFWR